ncbi:MAG: hypothetical protein Tsb0018_12780 [Opitutales bacterium]|tara:strand:- start:169 stop:585 length:417 start_codon:yes stop_codon:yes gene_type:complete
MLKTDKVSLLMPTLVQLMFFGGVGILSTLVHLAIVIGLVEFELMAPFWANPLAFLIAFFVSYYGNYYLTFQIKTANRGYMVKFFATACLGFVLNQSLFVLLYQYFGVNYQIALLVTLGTVAAITFVLSKCWAFKVLEG